MQIFLNGDGIMQDIVIFGAGSFGKEVAQLIKDINCQKHEWNLLGFIDEVSEKKGTVINSCPVLGDIDWLERNAGHDIQIVCAIGNPKGKKSVIDRLSGLGARYANLVHPSVIRNEFIDMGYGNIICCNTILSVNTRIGNHVALNPGCGIGHDTVIGNFTTLYWDVTLSGFVTINEGCEIGSKSVIISNKAVGRWSIIGAGAVVVKDIPDFCTAVGVPAKPIKFSDGQ